MGGPGTWGSEDHCINSRRYGKNSSPRAPDQQVSETGRVVTEKPMQGWTQMGNSNYKSRVDVARKEEFI